MNTSVQIAGITLKNPVIAASGTFGFGREMASFMDLSSLGGISSKGLTLEKRPGNDGIRVWETASGLMNSIGLQNPGVAGFIENELPFMLGQNTEIIANLGGGCMDDYVAGAKLLAKTGLRILELNISCPNVKEGGMAFGIREDDARRVVRQVRAVWPGVLMVKLSPNAERLTAMAETCVQEGADALSLVNTFQALAVDIRKRKPVFRNVTAGLSGPAIKPIALRMVRDVCRAVQVPVVGLGGIMSAEDAIEFIMVGATAIQVGTGTFLRPDLCAHIVTGIEAFCVAEGIKSLDEIRGII